MLHVPWRKASAHQKLARGLAIYCGAVLIIYGWKPVFTNASQPVRGITDPVIALQMSRNLNEVDAVLGDSPSPDREVMRIKQYLDFAFIPGYVALALVLGQALAGVGKCRTLARAAQVMALIAGLLDALENFLTIRLLNLPLAELDPLLLRRTQLSSLTKWACLAAAITLFAITLIGSTPIGSTKMLHHRMTAFLALAGALLTAFGLFENVFLLWGGLIMISTLLLMAATLKIPAHESVT